MDLMPEFDRLQDIASLDCASNLIVSVSFGDNGFTCLFRVMATIARLPKVYGPGGNAALGTAYRYRLHPEWRGTHGFVANVAAAIVLVATHGAAGGRICNVGEAHTPAVAGRLAQLPPSPIQPDASSKFNFSQDIALDASRYEENWATRR
jgi:nucleoside-diphosphate-sugar epimerase